MINSRDLKDLLPKVAAMASNFIVKCKESGIDVIITSTYRDNESQNALYAQGRTTGGKVVTNAKGGQSYHNYQCAFDFVPIINGKAQWNDLAAFKKCGAIAVECGLEWAGNWNGRMKELAHCQFTGGHGITYFQNGGSLS